MMLNRQCICNIQYMLAELYVGLSILADWLNKVTTTKAVS